LSFTREGKIVIGIALVVGFGAINTGNNLLFLGWGLLLSGIVLSGIMSEAALKPLTLTLDPPAEARVGQVANLPLSVTNTAHRLPAFGLETLARLGRVVVTTPVSAPAPAPAIEARGGYVLRLEPGQTHHDVCRFVPDHRGLYEVRDLVAHTAYPFGFFRKSRRLPLPARLEFWVLPKVVEVATLARAVAGRLGETPAERPGVGDDYFSLRPYRAGDDLRRVHWRRVARTGRFVVVENEAHLAATVMLELATAGSDPQACEHAIATLGSLAEYLLARGLKVGVRAPGVLVVPEAGAGQRRAILYALARLDPQAPLPPVLKESAVRLGLCGSGTATLVGVDAEVAVPAAEPCR